MATVIHNPSSDAPSQNGWGPAITILAIIVLGLLAFFVFGRGAVPDGESGSPQVTIPVNVGGDAAPGATGGSADAGAATP